MRSTFFLITSLKSFGSCDLADVMRTEQNVLTARYQSSADGKWIFIYTDPKDMRTQPLSWLAHFVSHYNLTIIYLTNKEQDQKHLRIVALFRPQYRPAQCTEN